jgi:N6-adenosine-specific RNA methylase IME4
MTEIFRENNCLLIEQSKASNIFRDNDEIPIKYQLKNILFKNFKRKQKVKSEIVEKSEDLKRLNEKIQAFITACRLKNLFPPTDEADIERLKTLNVELSNKLYESSFEFGFFHGENNLNEGRLMTMNNSCFLIPPHCKFFNKKIEDIESFLPPNDANKFDFIVIDPPWKNRYIKRVKKSSGNKQGYSMMSDDEIVKIPLENYLCTTSIVVIWSTNSETHIRAIRDEFLCKWKLKLLSSWQWIKVDNNGELFCAIDGNKKPFEQIFIATHETNCNYDKVLEEDLMLFSQPSSIHSHKPQLIGKRSNGANIFRF